ncbi:hypothetical protein H5410_052393 [Solanum commersonii]|uniref:Uncharacterized protein n=1 Tax=Solanum commersonii TaxID=4109 RepID=A0A9J5X3H7_SOLCO|nr:hypothetical protein H5410_052393 [Solanum commersonii]
MGLARSPDSPILPRSLLRRVGNPTIRHSFCQANKVANTFAKGVQLASCNLKDIFVTPLASMSHIYSDADKQGMLTDKLVSMTTCNYKLASFGNLSILLDLGSS